MLTPAPGQAPASFLRSASRGIRTALGTALLSTLLALGLLQWRHVSDRARMHQAVSAIDHVSQARLYVARAWLVLRVAHAGDAAFPRADADAALDRASLAVDDWLAGRPLLPGGPRAPLVDDELRDRVERYGARIHAFRTRLADPATPAAAVDARRDFAALEAAGDSIEHRALAVLARADARGEAAHALTLFAVALCAAFSAVSLHAAGTAGRRAARRSEQMHALAAALAAAETPRDVAAAAAEHGIRGVGAPMGTVGVLVDEGRTVEILATAGYRDADLEGWMRFPNAGELPVPIATATRQAVFAESRAEILERFPALAAVREASGFRATAVVPLVTGEAATARSLGYVAFEFREDRGFSADDRRFLEMLGRQTAQAMARALSHDAEREARAQAQAERRRLALVLERLPVGVIVVGPGGRVLQHNPALEEILGHPAHAAEDVSGYSAYGGVHPDGRPYAADEYPVARALLRGEVVVQEPTRYRRGDGREVMLSISAAPVRDGSGATLYAVAAVQDVSPLHEAQRALRESEARFRDLAERLPLGVYRNDPAGNVLYCNPRLPALLGHTEAEFRDGTWLRDVHPDDREALLTRRMIFRQGLTDAARFDFRIVDPASGAVRHVTAESALLRDEAGVVQGSVGVVEDVTQQRALEAQLRQAQKMEAVGRLAGGVAHDFNNLLQVVAIACNVLLTDTAELDPRRMWIQEIQDAQRRAADLTRQLLVFSRRQLLHPEAFDLNDLAQRSARMLRRLIGEDVRVTLALASGLPSAWGDPGQVEQALVNLAVNARDAMPDGGDLTVSTSRAELDEAYAASHPDVTPGSYLVLAVADTGTGMDAETLSHVFEPFFTTKEAGKGTGLGLSMVYGAARQMGGHVSVYSEPGIGSTFKLYVPEAEVPAGAPVPAPAPAPRGTETVLVVEDDPGVRRVVHVALSALGYTVLEAEDGAAALRLVEEYTGPLHVLLTDVVLPGMGGRAIADAVTRVRPEVAVLFMSGYTADAILRQRVREGELLVEKPFTGAQLGRAIRQALDQRDAGDGGGGEP